MLTRDFAMRALVGRVLDTSADQLDAAGVLQWSTRAPDVARFTELPPNIRDGVSGWLADTAGPVAEWALAAARAGHSTDAVPLGLVAGLLRQSEWQDGAPAQRAAEARVRDGTVPRWRAAASRGGAGVERGRARLGGAPHPGRPPERGPGGLAGGGDPRRAAGRGTAVTFDGAARSAARELATAIQATLPAPDGRELEAAERALERIHDHTLAADDQRVLVATMAVRLLRWLARGEPQPPATVARAVECHVREDGWVDRARLDVWTGDSDPVVAEAYRALFRAVDARRVRRDERFGELLAASTAADGPPGSILHVEDVLPRVVRPVVNAGQQVLLVVADGMGGAASTEIVDDIARSGWVELSPQGGPRVGVLAALPTVTEVCRASLLAGRLCRGGQQRESEGLTEQLGPSARLFHKDDLMAGAGAALPATVTEAIQDPDVPVVAAVLNTIDDALDRSDPAGAWWNLDTLRPLRALLQATHDRVVVLTSDHGHVVDRGPDAEPRPGTGADAARWRPATSPPGEGEVLVRGRRVALGGGQVILPWKETVRYTSRRAGYHGGASPAEAVIPLTVLTSGASASPPGWAPAPPQAPPWWLGPAHTPPAAAAGEPVEPAPAGEGRLFDTAGQPTAPVAEPAAERAATLADTLLASDIYGVQRRRAGRAALSDERVRTLLDALLARGGRAAWDSLAQAAGIPAHRVRTTLAMLQRLLNVEGYPVVSLDPDGVTVVLDERLLREQFDLGARTR